MFSECRYPLGYVGARNKPSIGMQCQSRILGEMHFFRTGEEYPKGRRGYNITLSENEINRGPRREISDFSVGLKPGSPSNGRSPFYGVKIRGPRQITAGDLTGQKKNAAFGAAFLSVCDGVIWCRRGGRPHLRARAGCSRVRSGSGPAWRRISRRRDALPPRFRCRRVRR